MIRIVNTKTGKSTTLGTGTGDPKAIPLAVWETLDVPQAALAGPATVDQNVSK